MITKVRNEVLFKLKPHLEAIDSFDANPKMTEKAKSWMARNRCHQFDSKSATSAREQCWKRRTDVNLRLVLQPPYLPCNQDAITRGYSSKRVKIIILTSSFLHQKFDFFIQNYTQINLHVLSFSHAKIRKIIHSLDVF